MTRRTIALAVAALAAIVVLAVWAGRSPQPHELLRDVYMPSFSSVPREASLAETTDWIRGQLESPAGKSFLTRLLPDQTAVLWIMLVVAAVVAFDFGHIRSGRNVDLFLAWALGLSFFDIMRLARIELTPESRGVVDAVFTAVVSLNLALAAHALWQARTGERRAIWMPGLRGRPLAALAVVLVLTNVLVGLMRDPDDAGYFTNLGGQRLRERGRLPYGDPMLTGTPGAAYGPVLYAAHIPFQLLIDPRSPNPVSSPTPPMGDAASYYLPSPLATKLTTLSFHLAGLFALWAAGRRLTSDPDVGWALVALYCASAFVLGVGGETEFIGGITFISHIAPTATMLIAFACLPSPMSAGVMLAVSTGAGFYPAFMLPAWTAFFWRDRQRCVRFVAGFALAAAVIGFTTLALSRPANGRGRIGTILWDTFGHHTDPEGYGRSPFGFWGQQQGLREWLNTPLVGDSGLTTPAWAAFFGLVATTVWIARGASPGRLALLSAAIALAASAIKIHASGTYVAWAYPFLLIGLFANRESHGPGRI